MKKIQIKIYGMHCKSCEILIENEIKNKYQIHNIDIDHKTGFLNIDFFGKTIPKCEINKIITDLGYSLKPINLPWFSTNINDYFSIFFISLVLIVGYLYLKDLDIFKFSFLSNDFANLFVVILIGVAAGVSTCMALVGGIVVSITAKYIEAHPDLSPKEKFIPHLYFNLGRIVGFFIFGGILGTFGSLLFISTKVVGLFTILIGLLMLSMGIQLLKIFPRFSNFSLTFPKYISNIFNLNENKEKVYSHLNTMILGAMTFFLPCGFTQTVQLYAATTGNFMSGALVMTAFAVGTSFGLIGIGMVMSFVKENFFNYFFRVVGVIVIFLSIYNISNGWNLASVKIFNIKTEKKVQNINGEVQLLKTIYTTDSDISPKDFKVKVGQPVRLEVDVRDNGFGCMGSFTIPGLTNQVENLRKGKTLIFEFTPQEVGEYQITCAMGVPRGKIIVE